MNIANKTQTRIRSLAELPNREGYRFIGIDRDGNERFCCIKSQESTSCYYVLAVSGKPINYTDLIGWRDVEKVPA